MDDEIESDSEREGIDGLRLLKAGVVPEEVKEKSVAMVPLLPAQKRARALSREIGDNDQPSSIQKVEGSTTEAGRSKPWGMVRREEGQSREHKDLREHRSAPHQGSSLLERQLRSCRSAPNLALPALAATVRGLQDGTIQVDRHTRLQIASAAKRVLEAREAKRRLSNEGQRESKVTPSPASKAGPQDAVPAPITPRSSQPSVPQRQAMLAEAGPTLSNADKVAEAPTSLATAAAIARGESLPLPAAVPLSRGSSDAAVQFHRPAALGTARLGSSLVTSPPKHTVTTGLPKYSEGPRGSGGARLVGAPSAVNIAVAKEPPASGSGGTGLQSAPSSKTLTVSDLFKHDGPATKNQD